MNAVKLDNNRIVVIDEENLPRYSFPANEPARNEHGRETGATWAEEFAAGRLYVGQESDGDSVGAVWAQSALPEPKSTQSVA